MKRLRSMLMISACMMALFALALVLPRLLPSVAAAVGIDASGRQPDLWIQGADDVDPLGDDVYSLDGTGQTSTTLGETAFSLVVTVQNDGPESDDLIVKGPTSIPSGWDVIYYDPETYDDVTAQITGTGWSTGALDPGALKTLEIIVTTDETVPYGASLPILVTATSVGDTTKKDAVKALINILSYQPDGKIRTAGATDYLGNDIYNLTGASQTATKTVASGATAVYDVQVENDGDWYDTFTVSGTAGAAPWTVAYYEVDGATETDITDAVVAGTYSSWMVDPAGTVQFRIEVTPAGGASGSFPVTLTVTSETDTAAKDVVKATTSITGAAKPDLWIRNSYDTYVGDDIYNLDGTNQTKNQPGPVGTTIMYLMQVQNDGPATDTLKVTGTGGATGWSVYYKDTATGVNVTSQVIGSGWSTGALAPGEKKGLYIQVVPSASLALGTARTMTITATSTTDTTKKDVVKAITTASPNYQADLWIRPSTEATYIGDHIYSTDGLNQTKSLSTPTGTPAMYLFQVQNDCVTVDSFMVTGTAGGNGWTVAYYDTSTNANITTQVTGSGWATGSRNPGLSKGLYAKVTPTTTVAGGTQHVLLLTAASVGSPARKDVVRAVTTATVTAKPDLWLRKSSEANYSGDNVYGTDGANQSKALTVANGSTASYLFQVQNDGSAVDSFKVTGTAGGSGWTVTYRDTSTGADITTAVTGAGWTVSSLAKGNTKGLYVQVRPSGIPVGSAKTVLLTATSVADGTKKDVVRVVTTAAAAPLSYQPDLHIRNSSDSYIGDNVYSADGANQTKSQSTTGAAVTYLLQVQNDGNSGDAFKITGTAGDANWTVVYRETSTGSDITTAVTGTGWTAGPLAVGVVKGFYIQVTPKSTAIVGAIKTLTITAVSIANNTKKDVALASTTKTQNGGGGTEVVLKSYGADDAPKNVDWVAFQDGNGGWATLAPVSTGVYRGTVTDAGRRYGLAYKVTYSINVMGQTLTREAVYVHQATTSEINEYWYTETGTDIPNPQTVRVSGTIANIAAGTHGDANIGWDNVEGTPNYTVDVEPGAYDLGATQYTKTGYMKNPPTKMTLERNVAINAATTKNFDLNTGFSLTPNNFTVTGIETLAALDTIVSWSSKGGVSFNCLAAFDDLTATHQYATLPADRVISGDRYMSMLMGTYSATLDASRTLIFANAGNKTTTVPAAFDSPSVTGTAGSGYLRPQASWSAYGDPNTRLYELDYPNVMGMTDWTVYLTKGWLPTQATHSYTVPDYNGLSGWSNSWGLPNGVPLSNWSASVMACNNPMKLIFPENPWFEYGDGMDMATATKTGSDMPGLHAVKRLPFGVSMDLKAHR